MTGAKVFKLGAVHKPRPGLSPVILRSPAIGTSWKMTRLRASLRDREVGPGNGIHAYRNLRAAVAAQYDAAQRDNHPHEHAVYAIVRPEGEVVIGELGWVAEAVVIQRIFLPIDIYLGFGRHLYERYRVPVEPLPRSLRASPIAAMLADKNVETPRPLANAFNLRYTAESGASIAWAPASHVFGSGPRKIQLRLRLPRGARTKSNVALYDPEVARMGRLRVKTLARETAKRERRREARQAERRQWRFGRARLKIYHEIGFWKEDLWYLTEERNSSQGVQTRIRSKDGPLEILLPSEHEWVLDLMNLDSVRNSWSARRFCSLYRGKQLKVTVEIVPDDLQPVVPFLEFFVKRKGRWRSPSYEKISE